MYNYLKKYRLAINFFLSIILIILFLLKLKGVAISYTLFLFIVLGGTIFNHRLISFSKKVRKE